MPHCLFMQWLIFISVLLFSLWLIWSYGFFELVFINDPTRISSLIGLFFFIGTVHCAQRVVFLSKQLNQANNALSLGGALFGQDRRALLQDSLISSFITSSRAANSIHTNNSSPDQLIEVLIEQTRGEHELGWFVSSLLIKLGLLGTVVGFILMLGSLADIDTLEFSNLQDLISSMAVGMGVALITTLVGLLSSILLSFQYLLLDRTAEKIIAKAIYLVQMNSASNNAVDLSHDHTL